VRGEEGDHDHADLRVRVDVGTWRDLNAGRIGAPQALLRRRIHLEGDFLLGLRLHLILG
jgi:putative sterol carrier protein